MTSAQSSCFRFVSLLIPDLLFPRLGRGERCRQTDRRTDGRLSCFLLPWQVGAAQGGAWDSGGGEARPPPFLSGRCSQRLVSLAAFNEQLRKSGA